MMKRFRALSTNDKLTVLSLWGQLALTDIRLKAVPYRFNKNYLSQSFKNLNDYKVCPKENTVKRLSELTAIAAAHPYRFNMSCLRKALVIRQELLKRGIPARLVYGARKSLETAEKHIAVHAWVEADTFIVDPIDNSACYEQFTKEDRL